MIIGNKIYRKKHCQNSLQWAKNEIEAAPDGTVFLAEIHEYARGRHGKTWNTYPGQLLITILLKPKDITHIYFEDIALKINQLNMAISLGVLKILQKYGAMLKWPNDFMIQEKKVGGIITQVVWLNDDPQGIIVGLGINVNNLFDQSDELHNIATSIKTVLGKEIDTKKLLNQLLSSIDTYYKQWLDKKFETIYTTYKKNQAYLYKKITVQKNLGPSTTGTFLDVLPNGNIILEYKNGKKEEIDFAVVENFEPYS
jgi:BirA family biotin operon repressor/biotin-[acetyl-CoA-carboxylase] ligase